MKRYILAAATVLAISGFQRIQAEDPDYMYVGTPVKLDKDGVGLVEVYLNTTEPEYNAFEMNIYLPEGFVIKKNDRDKYDFQFNTADKVYDHAMAVNDKPVDYYRIIGFSVSSSFIATGDGLLFTFPIQAPEDYDGTAPGIIRDIMFAAGVTPETASAHHMEPCSFTIEPYDGTEEDDPSAVEAINADELRGTIYNLQGIRVEGELTPGLYIIDGKKVLIK